MLSFLQTLILTLAILVLSHEADAFVSDWFEQTTGTEMRLVPVVESIEGETEAQEAEINVMPVHTKKTKSMRNKIAIHNAYGAFLDFGGGNGGVSGGYIPVNVSPARL